MAELQLVHLSCAAECVYTGVHALNAMELDPTALPLILETLETALDRLRKGAKNNA